MKTSRARNRVQRTKNELKPIRPNAGLEARFRRDLIKLVDEMHDDIMRQLVRAYRDNPPLAQDKLPAITLQEVLKKLDGHWRRRFETASRKLASYYTQAITNRSDAQLRSTLQIAGFAVKFQMTKELRDVLKATMAEQVGLIRSIPEKYLGDVQGLVMRSVTEGRDLGMLTKEIRKRYHKTKKRAAFIARDQNNKATATINRTRQIGLGITKAIWRHSHAGREPRPTHVANSGKKYNVKKGWYDPAIKKWIWPGTEPNCRCTSTSIIPGLSKG